MGVIMKFNIITMGCKVNTYESNYMSESLVNNGFLFCDDIKTSDIVIKTTIRFGRTRLQR